jgi:hypothetical protein
MLACSLVILIHMYVRIGSDHAEPRKDGGENKADVQDYRGGGGGWRGGGGYPGRGYPGGGGYPGGAATAGTMAAAGAARAPTRSRSPCTARSPPRSTTEAEPHIDLQRCMDDDSYLS